MRSRTSAILKIVLVGVGILVGFALGMVAGMFIDWNWAPSTMIESDRVLMLLLAAGGGCLGALLGYGVWETVDRYV